MTSRKAKAAAQAAEAEAAARLAEQERVQEALAAAEAHRFKVQPATGKVVRIEFAPSAALKPGDAKQKVHA